MTDQKQEKPKQPNWLIKASGEAILATGAAGIASFVFGVPYEYVTRVALIGPLLSIYMSWSHSKSKDKLKTKKAQKGIPFTTIKGTKYVDPYSNEKLEFSIEQGGYVLRESYGKAIWRKISHKGSRPIVKQIESVDRPRELDEFVFFSQGLQLRQVHIKLFLDRAWKFRKFGKGLSARQHIRNFSQMPAWYKELSPMWYYAAMDLLVCASAFTGHHLIVKYENGWKSLVEEPRLTMRILKWYEIEKRKR